MLKPGAGVPGLPKGIGAGVEVCPKPGFDVPKAGLSVVLEPKVNAPICGVALFATGVPNCGQGAAAPNLNGVDVGCVFEVGGC